MDVLSLKAARTTSSLWSEELILLQVLIPTLIAALGVILLLVDSYNKRFYFGNKSVAQIKSENVGQVQKHYKEIQFRAIRRLEKRDDKREVRKRLAEIDADGIDAFGQFKFNQIALVSAASLLPFAALYLIRINLISAIVLSIILSIATYFATDQYLSNKVKDFRFAIEAEFPAIIEMLTLAIGAGETPVNAFARVSERSESKLAREFSKVVNEVKAGRAFHESLDAMSRSLKSDSVRRFIDALVLAMVRGAPIVEVLHRHVAEARLNQRNLVMDKAGKAETTMMIPIVFLILPISVLFALWPSINQLSFFAG